MKATVHEDKDWVPDALFTSLYIRPFIIADDPALGVKAAKHYRFMIILAPSGSYYAANCAFHHAHLRRGRVHPRGARRHRPVPRSAATHAAASALRRRRIECDCNDVPGSTPSSTSTSRKSAPPTRSTSAIADHGNRSRAPSCLASRDSVLDALREWGIPAIERKLSIDEVVGGIQGRQAPGRR
ncbi:MAG: hypothetical protein R2912_02310 [Eubacteriales bacterium]